MKQILMKENLMDQKEVVEASSGSTAISLVHISHMLNKKATIFLPNDLAEDKVINQLFSIVCYKF